MAHTRRDFIFISGVVGLLTIVPGYPLSTGEQKMYGLIGRMMAVSGQRDALIAILLEGTAAMPGCLSYVIAKDPSDTNAIWITEVWNNQESHQASLSLPSVKQAIARGKPLIAGFDKSFVTEPVGGHGLSPIAQGKSR
jgi:quinol monooxygenase YgiN